MVRGGCVACNHAPGDTAFRQRVVLLLQPFAEKSAQMHDCCSSRRFGADALAAAAAAAAEGQWAHDLKHGQGTYFYMSRGRR
jgi:hypothetical protein